MRLYGLIGRPLTHSFSKKYFTEKFEKLGITDARYELFPLDSLDELKPLLAAHPDLRGLNVTIPFKQAVLPLLDELDETAAAVGAVNTISIGQTLKGYNTDVYGFRQSIKPFLTSQHERALILGTGGASKAVFHVLRTIGIDCAFVTRNKSAVPEGQLAFTYEEVNTHVVDAFRLIVNTTPLGMFPSVESCAALPYVALGSEHLLYDLVYNPAETEFMKRGKAHGARVMNGLDMLQLQAEKAWEIWNS